MDALFSMAWHVSARLGTSFYVNRHVNRHVNDETMFNELASEILDPVHVPLVSYNVVNNFGTIQ